MKGMFDFSTFSDDSKYYDDSNKLVVGQMKHEIGGIAINKFIGLKAKMYSFLAVSIKKAKDVNKNVVGKIELKVNTKMFC